MKQRILILFILLQFVIGVKAQCTFEQCYKYYDVNYYPYPRTIVTSDGGFLTTMTCDYDSLNPASQDDLDMAIVKNDSCGNTLRRMHYGFPNAADEASGAIETSTGEYLIAGTTEGGQSIGNIRVVKFSPKGTKIWDSIYTGQSESICFDIIKRNGRKGALLCGYMTSYLPSDSLYTPYIMEIDEDGNLIRSKRIKTHYAGKSLNYFIKILQPNDSTYDIFEIGQDTIYLIQTDTSFNLRINKPILYTSTRYLSSFVTNDKKNIAFLAHFTDSNYITSTNLFILDINGNFKKRLNFSKPPFDTLPGPPDFISPSIDNGYLVGLYLMLLDSNLNLLKPKYKEIYRGRIYSSTQLKDGSIITSGISYLLNTTFESLYINKMNSDGNFSYFGIGDAKSENNYLNIYPNPVIDELKIETNSFHPLQIEMMNCTGQIIYATTFTNSTTINTQTFAEGIYFLRITDTNSGKINTQKVAVVR